jgi:hypothetical protein
VSRRLDELVVLRVRVVLLEKQRNFNVYTQRYIR